MRRPFAYLLFLMLPASAFVTCAASVLIVDKLSEHHTGLLRFDDLVIDQAVHQQLLEENLTDVKSKLACLKTKCLIQPFTELLDQGTLVPVNSINFDISYLVTSYFSTLEELLYTVFAHSIAQGNVLLATLTSKDKEVVRRYLFRSIVRGRMEHNDSMVIRVLLHIFSMLDSVHFFHCNGDTLLHKFCQKNDTEFLRMLLMYDVDVDTVNKSLQTPLTTSCLRSSLEVILLLLQNGASIDSIDSNGHYPLLNACMAGRKKIVDLLVKFGANLNIQDEKGNTVLMSSCAYPYVEISECLIVANPSLLERVDYGDNTPLMKASRNGCLLTVKMLLRKGANVNAVNIQGKSAMAQATLYKQVHVAEFLLANGADG